MRQPIVLCHALAVVVMVAMTTTRYPQSQDGVAQSDTSRTMTLMADGCPPLPHFDHPVDDPKTLRTLYVFAAEHPEVLNYIRCYCVCGQDFHHKSNEDCFVKVRGTRASQLIFNAHAGECEICLSIAKEVRQLYLQGKSVRAIRRQVDADFEPRFNHHTDTPLPPPGRG